MVYNALLTAGNDQWQRTLLIVLYDEHGGFYDHVDPTQWAPQDDRLEFRRYGVRVPALVISPWVSRRVAYGSQPHHLRSEEVVFDHTSILKTILRRFRVGEIPHLTTRVDAAHDLSELLTENQARRDCTRAPAVPDHAPPRGWWRRFYIDQPVRESSDLQELQLLGEESSDLQESLWALAQVAKKRGVPHDKL